MLLARLLALLRSASGAGWWTARRPPKRGGGRAHEPGLPALRSAQAGGGAAGRSEVLGAPPSLGGGGRLPRGSGADEEDRAREAPRGRGGCLGQGAAQGRGFATRARPAVGARSFLLHVCGGAAGGQSGGLLRSWGLGRLRGARRGGPDTLYEEGGGPTGVRPHAAPIPDDGICLLPPSQKMTVTVLPLSLACLPLACPCMRALTHVTVLAHGVRGARCFCYRPVALPCLVAPASRLQSGDY